MSNAVILAVDENVAALSDVERTLRDRYARDYSVTCVRSSREALAYLHSCATADDRVALVLAAQWLSEATGSELLREVRTLHPHARRALLVPWNGLWDNATGEAVYDAIALGHIDHYVIKPSAAPDEQFH